MLLLFTFMRTSDEISGNNKFVLNHHVFLKMACIYSDTFTHFTIGLKSDLASNFHWVFFVIIVSGINFLITFLFFTYIWVHEGHQWEWKTERRKKRSRNWYYWQWWWERLHWSFCSKIIKVAFSIGMPPKITDYYLPHSARNYFVWGNLTLSW